MSELVKSNLIANALLDITDRNKVLIPYLSRIQDIQGKQVDILFTDFQGGEIARNGRGNFSASDLAWLRDKLAGGQAASRVQPGDQGDKGDELLAVELIVLPPSNMVEGALLYKISLDALGMRSDMQLVHGQASAQLLQSQADTVGVVPVYVIKDNGEGFDMALADKLFRSFQRLHTAQEFPGAGADLVKAQRIMERHHGQVWAESAPDEGARFFFKFGQ